MRWVLVLLIALGVLVSGHLLLRHFALADLSSQTGTDFCSALFGTGCDDALRSPLAVQLGLPLAGWGLVYYGTLVALLLLEYLHLLPAWIPGLRRFAGGLAYFLIAGFIALAVWVWRGMIRPTYVRMAPGIIQVLEYRYSKSRPTIRSYPMQPGTLVVLTRIRKHLILTLARGESKDMLLFSRMQQPGRKIERAWQALLSTAPTPPLDAEQLVG